MAKFEKKRTKAARSEKVETVVESDGANACEHGELHVKASVPENRDGFRRAGIFFPRDEKVIIAADSLSQERYDAITNERMLNVVEVEPGAAKEPVTNGGE
jgi:hypothetical protein